MNTRVTHPKKRFVGVAVAHSKDKTVKVRVSRTVMHKKYKKRYLSYSHFLVHDPRMAVQKDERVVFEQCRPLSRRKRWVVVYH